MPPVSAIRHRTLRFAAALLRNFLEGCRAALLLPVAVGRRLASWLQIVAALLLCVLPPLLSQWADVGSEGEFSFYGLQGIVFPFALCVVVAALWTHRADGVQRLPALLLVLVNLYLAIDSAGAAAWWLLQRQESPYASYVSWYFDGAWLGLAGAVLLARQPSTSRGRARLRAIVAGCVLALLLIEVMPEREIWSDAYAYDATQDRNETLAEDVLYQQADLLDQKLDRIEAATGDAPNLYFLGVAGDAQNVFRRELRSVHKQFLERFATHQHSLLLINNRETLRGDPIASVTAIQAAIDRFAEVMDRDRDILFIYMTSHGSQEHGLALEMPPLALADLAPARLRSMLDESGIRWRVIVVSACYSGTFIAPLADAHTLVIAAAAADKTSFGCADENDFTYFGRAYFVDGLSTTDSFIDAFDVAKKRVTERELAEKQTPSDPQIAIGEQIRTKLDEFLANRRRAN